MNLVVAKRRCATAVGAVLMVSALAGCSTHDVAIARPCPGVTAKKAVAISNRGGIGLAKLGLTPEALKAQEDCS